MFRSTVPAVQSRLEEWRGCDPCDHFPGSASSRAHGGRPVHGRSVVPVVAYLELVKLWLADVLSSQRRISLAK
ncbi:MULTISPECIES: hypothetical protein [Acetobacter]|uniref:hypothetical protein n=1 Tax=Acetobacter TaxID=434 RepID=UPI0013C2A08A|nr:MULTISPECIES: hypothetical protein [Acetobacter]